MSAVMTKTRNVWSELTETVEPESLEGQEPTAALSQLRLPGSVLAELLNLLTRMNRQDVAQLSGGTFTVAAGGIVHTPDGQVTGGTVRLARHILGRLPAAPERTRGELVRAYTALIPQHGFAHPITGSTPTVAPGAVAAQEAFLNLLSWTVDAAPLCDPNRPSPLRYQVELLQNEPEYERVNRLYQSGRDGVPTVLGRSMKRVYALTDVAGPAARLGPADGGFGNAKLSWFGTCPAQCLSALRGGLASPAGPSASSSAALAQASPFPDIRAHERVYLFLTEPVEGCARMLGKTTVAPRYLCELIG